MWVIFEIANNLIYESYLSKEACILKYVQNYVTMFDEEGNLAFSYKFVEPEQITISDFCF